MAKVSHLQAVATRKKDDVTTGFRPVSLGEHFHITPSGLEVRGSPPFEACEALWAALRTLECSLQFAVGDAVNDFEGRWGERASQIIDASGLSLSSVKVYAWVAKQVPSQNRMIDRGLSFAHHLACAALPHAEQRSWLTQALGNGGGQWSVSRLKAAIREGSDLEPSAWFVIVTCDSEAKQQKVLAKLESDGLTCKAVERRKKKAKEL